MKIPLKLQASPALSRSESLDAVAPPPPTPAATLSACGSTGDFTAAAAAVSGHQTPSAAMINSRVSRLAESSREQAVTAVPPSSDMSSEVLAQLKEIQSSIGSLESSLAGRFDAQISELGKRIDAQKADVTLALQSQAQVPSVHPWPMHREQVDLHVIWQLRLAHPCSAVTEMRARWLDRCRLA